MSLPLTEENFKALEEKLDSDTNSLLEGSILLAKAESDIISLRAELAKAQAELAIQIGFNSKFLNTIEGLFDESPEIFSYEHRDEYIDAAEHFEKKYDRVDNRIRQMKEANDQELI